MISYRTMLFAVVAALGATMAVDSPAQAGNPGCSGPFCNTPRYSNLHSYVWRNSGNKQPLPVFQAAPWYLYWPYDGHFQTPAPVTAPYYAPPATGNFPANPYFPGPAGGGYGPIPGGPAPAGVPVGGFGVGAIAPPLAPPLTPPFAPVGIPQR